MSNGVGESFPVTISDSNTDIPDPKRSSANKIESKKLETKKKPAEKSPSNKLRSRSTITKKSGNGKHKSSSSCNIKSEPQPWESFTFTPPPARCWEPTPRNEEIPTNEESYCIMDDNTMNGYPSENDNNSGNTYTRTFDFGCGFIPFLNNAHPKRGYKKDPKKIVFNLYLN